MALFDHKPARPLVHLDEALVQAPAEPGTPMLDQHLADVMTAPVRDVEPKAPLSMADAVTLIKAQITPTPKASKGTAMDPITIANLVIMGLGLIADLVKTIKQSESGAAADDAVFSHAGDFLAKVGTVAKVKELNPDSINAFMPAIKDLITKVHELRKLAD